MKFLDLVSATGVFALALAWAALFAVVVFLASVPTSVATQALLSLLACSLIYVMKPGVTSNMTLRFVVLSIAGTFVLRYWLWRLFETLPSFEDPVSLAAALVLFAAESFTVAIFFLTALINSDPVDPPKPAPVRLEDVPTVDILIPSYNESEELLAVTLAAATRINYPAEKKRVVLCDDGGTDARCNHTDLETHRRARERRASLQGLCRELGVEYTTRARNERAKAGNLNAALRHLDGELVLVLDADHVPTRDFLARTVGYMVENPRLFLVQSPHFFTNRDPIERNLALPETSPSENEMFYAQIHRGLDRFGGAFFCGSAALLRRQALDEVGGIAGETITEDAETALDIHARGWESLYLDHAMVAGLQPETFASFLQQRGRWATGMIQMLMLKNPIFRSGLSLKQRLCYLNSMSFWLFPAIRMIFLLMPLLYLFFGLEIYVVTTQEVLAYILPYLLIGFMVQNALFGCFRWPQISEVYEIAQTPYLLKAVVHTVLRPRHASFKVTAKDETLDHAFLSPVYAPLAALAALLLAGLVAGAYRWAAFPGDRAVVEIVGAWNLYNFLLVAYALRAVFERPDQLDRPRCGISSPAMLRWSQSAPGEDEQAAEVHAEIVAFTPRSVTLHLGNDTRSRHGRVFREGASTGLKIELVPTLPQAPELEAPLPLKVKAVRSDVEGTLIELDVAPAQMIAASRLTAHLVYGDSLRWHFFRKVYPQGSTLIAGLAYVAGKSLMSVPKSVIGFLTEPARRRREATEDAMRGEPAFVVAPMDRPEPRPARAPLEAAAVAGAADYLVIEE